MTYSLASLPPDVLDQILGFKVMSAVINLWLSGDKHIQHSMASGLTCVELSDKRPFVICRLPKFLQCLRLLRELTVDRYNEQLFYMDEARQVVQNLSPTLRDLKLVVLNSPELVAPSSPFKAPASRSDDAHMNEDASSKIQWSLATAFPQLHTLELSHRSYLSLIDVHHLPASLTQLYASPPKNKLERIAFMQALPRRLTSYSSSGVCDISAECIPYLPPHLTYLSCGWLSASDAGVEISASEIALLPRTLAKTLNCLPSTPSLAKLEAFPPSMTVIDLDGTEGAKSSIDVDFGRLFPHLAELSTWSMDQFYTPASLRSLPGTVKYLHATIDTDNIELKDWPQSLTQLELVNCTPLDPKLLPPGLLTLRAYESDVFESKLSALPRGLLSLTADCAVCPAAETSFPPTLTKLHMSTPSYKWTIGTLGADDEWESKPEHLDTWTAPPPDGPPKVVSCFPIEAIPRTVTELILGCTIPASKLKALPRSLTRLSLISIVIDSDFKPNDLSEQASLLDIWQTGLSEGRVQHSKEASHSLVPPELRNGQASLASQAIALLPRELLQLDLRYVLFDSTDTNWCKYLPPSLRSMTFSSSLPPSFLDHAPLKCITNLFILLEGPTDDAMIALRKLGIPDLVVSLTGDESQLTSKGLIHFPPNGTLTSDTERLADMWRKLAEERRVCCESGDAEGLRKLLSTDEKNFPDTIWE